LHFYQVGGGWAVSLIWAMMILPLADALQNCLQNLTSRIAGLDNEQMTGRAMGMGAMFGYGIGAIKEQFKSPQTNSNIENSISSNNNSNSGLSGFLGKVKSVVSPNMNLSDSTDYNGNVNPIRDVIEKKKPTINTQTNTTIQNKKLSNKENSNQMSKGTIEKARTITSSVAKTGYQAGKTYLKVGANMAEGNFNVNQNFYKQNTRKNNFKKTLNNTEYLNTTNKIANAGKGDENEFKSNN
jgi:hypothetical protein